MPRLGQNPAKFVDHVAQPAPVTVALVTYIPFLGGYYAESLQVLQRSLDSLWANTRGSYDLLVFDNASCPEVRALLLGARQQGRIQYLVLSDRNVGKAGAWNFIFSAAPGEFIAYADGDIFFHPGWLTAQLEIMHAMPNLGMLTGMPVRNPERFSTSTVAWAESDPLAQLERGRLMPWEDFWRHVRSLGIAEAEGRRLYDEGEDICLSYQGRQFYVGAGHFQFLARRQVLQEVLPLPSRRPMGEVRLLDVAINERGYLRLSTPEWWVQHMGNTLGEADLQSGKPGQEPEAMRSKGPHRWRNGRVFRRILVWLHQRTFDLLYKS
ncbi:MAG TPA: glycosyltransferase family A protein [Anaerolineales bacterium]|nr:glycosyltransferase family A protein [Anaerolineales bacterium]